MARLALFVFFAPFLCRQTGCIFFRPAALTKLTLTDPGRPAGEPKTFGMKDVLWAPRSDRGSEVVGHGWHPREHETYAFWVNEGYPRGMHWCVHLRRVGPDAYAMRLVLDPDQLPGDSRPHSVDSLEFAAEAPLRGRSQAGRFTATLRDVPLVAAGDATRRLMATGRIVAFRASEEKFDALVDPCERTILPAGSTETSPTPAAHRAP